MSIKLQKYCTKVGGIFKLFQSSGGNISLKIQNKIFVKSSGTTIAEKKFTLLPLENSKQKVLGFIKKKLKKIVFESENNKPSIETSFHVLLEKKIVFHAHYIDVIAWTVDLDKRDRLMEIVRKNKFNFIPYVMPGIELTKKINLLQKKTNQIFILENHGIIITADSFYEIDEQLKKLYKIFDINDYQKKNYYNLSFISQFAKENLLKVPKYENVHNLAFTGFIQYCFKSVFFPDQVVFIKNYCFYNSIFDLKKTLINEPNNKISRIFLVKNVGVFFSNFFPGINFASDTLFCFYLLLVKLNNSNNLKKLLPSEISKIINCKNEIYRLSLVK